MEKIDESKHDSSLLKWRRASDIVWNVFLNGVIGYVLTLLYGFITCAVLIGLPLFSSYHRYAKHLFRPANCKLVQNREVKGGMKVLTFLHTLLFGWEMYLLTLVVAGLCYITVIYIPIAKQLFRQAKFFFNPASYTFEVISYWGVKEKEKAEAVTKEEKEAPAEVVKENPAPVETPKAETEVVPAKPEEARIILLSPKAETPKTEAAPKKEVNAAPKKPSKPHSLAPRGPLVIQYFNYGGKKAYPFPHDKFPFKKGPYQDWANKVWYQEEK